MLALLTWSSIFALLTAALPAVRQNAVQVVGNCQQRGSIALTFDDGPYIYEGAVSNDLRGHKGTFFLNGNNYVCIYDKYQVIRDLHAAQHTLGSHTWSHPDLTMLSYDEIHDQLWKVEQAFIRILGLKPLYFRPPYGSYNDLVLQVLAERGYKKIFLWSDDTGDANGESVQSSESVYNAIFPSYPAPHLVLNHSPVMTTSQTVIPYAVPRLEKAGYQIVAVDTCMGSQGEWPYEYIGEPGQPDSTWVC